MKRRLLLTFLASLSASSWSSLSVAAASSDVDLAIQRCRAKLDTATTPHAFPRYRYNLALLLESSQVPVEDGEGNYGAAAVATEGDDQRHLADVMSECIALYESACANQTRPLDPATRIGALHRAGNLALRLRAWGREDEAERLYRAALAIRPADGGVNALSRLYATVFESLVQLLLRRSVSLTTLDPLEEDGGRPHPALSSALRLCHECASLCPDEPVVDEYRGAVLRRIAVLDKERRAAKGVSEQPSFVVGVGKAKEVYDAYVSAAVKSHSAAAKTLATEDGFDLPRYGSNVDEMLTVNAETDEATARQVWTRLIRHIILAGNSAREAGLFDEEERQFQFGYALISDERFVPLVTPDIRASLMTDYGVSLKKRGRMGEAAAFFREAHNLYPDDTYALVQLASITQGKDDLSRSVRAFSRGYVSGLFDGYSDRFERELVETLEYQGHLLVDNALQRNYWGTGGSCDALNGIVDGANKGCPTSTTIECLDLGCGTGLLGELLRKRFGDKKGPKLVIRGVDLSPRMVEISRSKPGVYDHVACDEVARFLKQTESNTVGAITASDVFIYVGALDEVFRESQRVLKKGGVLVFTIEGDEDTQGVRLLKSGRFGHTRSYVEDAARGEGLKLVEWKSEVLRKQAGEEVWGAVVTLRK